MKKYYTVNSSGQVYGVDHTQYLASFSDPYLTLFQVGEKGEMIIDKITQESEDEGFPE